MSRVSENFATCKSRQRTGHFKVSFCEPATMSSSWLAVCFTDDESQTGVQRQRGQQNSLFAAISALLLNFPFRNRSTSCSGVVTSTSITIMKYFCWGNVRRRAKPVSNIVPWTVLAVGYSHKPSPRCWSNHPNECASRGQVVVPSPVSSSYP